MLALRFSDAMTLWINLYDKARRNGIPMPAQGFARKWSRVGHAGVSGWLCARCGGEAAVLACRAGQTGGGMPLETAFSGLFAVCESRRLAFRYVPFGVAGRSVLRCKAAGFAFSRGIGCPETWLKVCRRFCFAVLWSGFFLQFIFTEVVACKDCMAAPAGKPVCVTRCLRQCRLRGSVVLLGVK